MAVGLFLGVGTALGVLALLGGGGKKGGGTNGGGDKPLPGPNGGDEAEACNWAIANKPPTYPSGQGGEPRKPPPDWPQNQWLAYVAYWRAYPKGAEAPTTPDELAAFARLLECVTAKLPKGGDKPVDPNPPDPNPPKADDVPPAGPMTTYEQQNADKAVQLKPQSVPPTIIPPPDNQKKQGQSEVDWLTNVAYWATYVDPGAEGWGALGKKAGPYKLPNPQSPWAVAWTRIRAYIAGKLADQPQPNPGNDVPPGGPITNEERAQADQAVAVGPGPSFVPTDVVPAPDNARKPGTTDADWLTNVAFWSTYRAPGSVWLTSGKQAGPVKITNPASAWATSWKRINAYVKLKLAQNPNPQPDNTPPQGAALTADEQLAITAALGLMLQEVDAAVVSPPDNVHKPGVTEADWQTNVVYWTVYRSPGSKWVTGGHTPAPVKIPNPQSPWVAPWKRINTRIKQLLADQPNPNPNPQPDNTPPAGDAPTLAELQAINAALALKLQQVDAAVVPPPDNVHKQGVSEADWQTNVAYWTVYRSPGSAWVTGGHTPAPVKIPNAQSPWAKVWSRINVKVKQQLAQQPNPNPNPQNPNEPPPQGAVVTADEQLAITAALALKLQQVDAAVVPPPDNVHKQGVTEADWQTNVVYWTVYRSPGSKWVTSGHTPAPVKIPNPQSPYVAVWKRINTRIKELLGNQQNPNPNPNPAPNPNEPPPAGNVITPKEKMAADLALFLMLQTVDASVVPPPDNYHKTFELGFDPPQSEADWQTNVTYWTVYRSPESEWVKAGHTPAPVKIPNAQSPYVAVWARINNYIKAQLG